MTEPWTTAVTSIKPNEVRVRGYDIADLMGRVSFGQAVYLILRGELPTDAVGKLMDAIVVSSIDHGATPPSALAARTVASTGASLSQAVGAGINSINRHHGGAIEDCARHLGRIIELAGDTAEHRADHVDRFDILISATGREYSGQRNYECSEQFIHHGLPRLWTYARAFPFCCINATYVILQWEA